MRRRHSLRFRVALAFAALGAGVSLLFALGIRAVAHDQAKSLIDQTLRAELDDYMSRRARNPASLPPDSASLRGYVTTPGDAGGLPAELRRLPPGQHEIAIAGTPYRVGVAERGGERHFILFNEELQQAREQRFTAYLVGGALLMSVLAAVGGFWLAGRVIAPVSELARAVAAASAENPPRLATDDLPNDELGELTRSFDRYMARLAAFIERERTFAADASHELRTPLAVIGGAAEVLVEDRDLSAAQAARVARIERAAGEMSALISALLLLAREDETPDDAVCDAAQVLRQIVDRYRAAARQRRIAIDLAVVEDARLGVPTALFSIVVANLVRNAVTHTEGGTVEVRLYGDHLTVADSGTGIDEDELGLVFERHYRGARSEGVGIGLSLVKRICDRQGWQIQLENRSSGGTLASLRFDAAAPAA